MVTDLLKFIGLVVVLTMLNLVPYGYIVNAAIVSVALWKLVNG